MSSIREIIYNPVHFITINTINNKKKKKKNAMTFIFETVISILMIHLKTVRKKKYSKIWLKYA